MEELEKLLRQIIRISFSISSKLFLTFGGLIAILASFGGMISEEYLPAGILFVAGIAMTALGTKWYWYPNWQENKKNKQKLQNIKYAELSEHNDVKISDLAHENYHKAVNDFNSINDIIKTLRDEDLKAQLIRMQAIAQKLITYLSDHPDKITLADQFVNYYQDRAVSLTRQFLEFEQMKLNTPEINNIKRKTKRTLEAFDEAYEAQFTRLLSDKMLELESELKVADQIMSDSGIQNTAPKTEELPPPYPQDNAFMTDRPFDLNDNHTTVTQKPKGRFQK